MREYAASGYATCSVINEDRVCTRRPAKRSARPPALQSFPSVLLTDSRKQVDLLGYLVNFPVRFERAPSRGSRKVGDR